MALTNFAALTAEAKTMWSMDLWKQARNASFINRFTGTGDDAVFQRITQLKKSEKGARAVITLLHDLEGDGVAGDRQLEGMEEAMSTGEQVIRIDQLRHANRNEGRLADQKSIVTFRENSRNVLSYWLADRIDQLAFLTLSGVTYANKQDYTARVGSDFPSLEFAADVVPPSAARVASFTATGLNIGGAISDVLVLPTWNMMVDTKAYMKEQYIRPIRGDNSNGEEVYHVFVTPTCAAALKKDPDYVSALRNARERSASNPLYKGGLIDVDGLVLHEHRHVIHGLDDAQEATSPFTGLTTGQSACQMLFCGTQAMGLADIGNPEWVEKEFDYDNSPGISVAKMFGMLKPQFHSIYSGTTEDFGVMSVYVRQS